MATTSKDPEVGKEGRPVWLEHSAREKVSREDIGEQGRVLEALPDL